MSGYSESELIHGIREHDHAILEFVYDHYFPYIESYIHQHGGSTEQARDIFQEGMIVLYKKIEAGKFSLICKLSTYLYAVCKRIWIQENRKLSVRNITSTNDLHVAEPLPHYGENSNEEVREIFDRHFNALSPECRQLLKLYFNDCKNEEIRSIMGFSTVAQVVDRKYRCKKKLIEKIRNDPSFRTFRNGKHEEDN